MILISRRDSQQVFERRDFEISPRSYLKPGEFLAAEILRSRQDLGENLDEILRSRRDVGEILGEFLAAEILRSRRDLGKNLGEFLAGKILRSRRDLDEILAISPAKNSPRFSPRSRRDLAEILVKILQGKR